MVGNPFRFTAMLAVCFSGWNAACCFGQQPPVEKAGVIDLFDGKSLSGWEGDENYWRVEDGVIRGEIAPGTSLDHNTWLVLKDRELGDFDLRLQVKLTGAPGANSGIQFRCQVDHVNHVSGYQADLDQGPTWLGRIYDEHGRALLVERGSRVHIAADGQQQSEVFANPADYAVLFRENDWNDYRIIAVGDRVAVYINGTLFSELWDEQTDAKDPQGRLAFQLHSGPETLVQFRDIRLQELKANDSRLGQWKMKAMDAAAPVVGQLPVGADGQALNFGFESGDLSDWTATGNAFDQQPVQQDGIASRWAGQTSGKEGRFFIGGFEKLGDAGLGTLTSTGFVIDQPYASFLIAGGTNDQTGMQLVEMDGDRLTDNVLFQVNGNGKEQMQRRVLDLRQHQGAKVAIRLVDQNPGAWGHLNFDDFRFHQETPAFAEAEIAGRSTKNPLLQHLVENPNRSQSKIRGGETTEKMFVPEGFSVDVIAAEPQLHQPMAFTFDAKGRLWIVEGHSYPTKRPEGEGLDRILIFSDENGDGTFESRKVFAEGLNLVSGMEVGHGGVWIGAAPQLLFIPDQNQDDVPDGDPIVLLDGFGYADTHETLNSFMWGPDGWLYGNQGVFNRSEIGKPGTPTDQRTILNAGVWRYHPVQHRFEVFAHGGSNQWGLDYDQHGQIFMTHCRSYWGRGSTTHVIQNGHYWNQVNSNYAGFISATPLPSQPAMKNYLLASARYGHGEGGAGKPGSRAVYGGHSHVGTMIYLGDNWPQQYRNHLFTHNLHGHQMNHQVNLQQAGGYNTVHAGFDMLLCTDPQFIGVDLKYGPDGAVYFSDWYDPRHCHNPDWEQWDRGNGRMYRMKFDDGFKPTKVDYSAADIATLIQAQLHPNAWHGRTARLELAARHAKDANQVSQDQRDALWEMASSSQSVEIRLNAIWALHMIDGLTEEMTEQLLADQSQYVRCWAVQLASESTPSTALQVQLSLLANDSSLMVRRYLASALPRLNPRVAWKIAESMAGQGENLADRELPSLIWYGLAGLMETDLPRAFRLAGSTQLPMLRDFIVWYAAKQSAAGRQQVVSVMKDADPQRRIELLQLFELGVRGKRGLVAPEGWSELARQMYDSPDVRVRHLAEGMGAAFGDRQLFQRMDQLLKNENGTIAEKQNALNLLAMDSKGDHLQGLLANLDRPELTLQILPMLKSYQDQAVAIALMKRFENWPEPVKQVAMEVLASRGAWSNVVLDRIESGEMDKASLSAFIVRQMAALEDESLNQRLEQVWGKLGQTSAERKAEIQELATLYKSAPLWAFSEGEGAKHFKQLCASCHQDTETSKRIAPRLEGTGSKGIDYIVENVLDPNAVIGQDFQARLVLTLEGRLISGLILEETDSALTIRTATGSETIAKDDIDEVKVSENSFMPEGLLKPLDEQERIELLKYLMSM